MILGLGLGLAAAWLVNYFVIKDLPLPDDVLTAVKLSVYIVSGLLNATFARYRCVTLLILPQMMTPSGLKFIKSSLLAAVLAGPVANIIFNGKSVIDSITCTAGIIRNLTVIRYTLTFQPFQRALMILKTSSLEVENALSSIEESVGPLLNEFLRDDETQYAKEYNDFFDKMCNNTLRSNDVEAKFPRKRPESGCDMSVEESLDIERFYARKLEYRCQNLLSASQIKCREIFSLTHTACRNILPPFLSSFLCWPTQLSYICNFAVAMSEDVECDPNRHLPSGWGRGVVALVKAKYALTRAVSPSPAVYVVEFPKVVDAGGMPEVMVDAKWDLERNSRWIFKIFKIVQIFVAVSFFQLVFDTARYHSRFLQEIDYDNIYVSQYFKKLDARRHAAGKHVLLPLKNRERSYFVFPTELTIQKMEAEGMEYELFNLVPMFFVVTAVVLIDRAFVEALHIVSRNTRIDLVREKQKETVVRVRGTGVLAKLIRSIVRQFDAQRQSNAIPTHVLCVPRAHLLRLPQLFHLYSILLSCGLIVILGSYGRRWRWAQVSFFYPRWAKNRSLFLYNDTLKRRKTFSKFRKTQIARLAHENKLNQDASLFLLLLRFKYPTALGWLAYICRRARRRCLICLYVEDVGCFNLTSLYVECFTCLYIYCEECWADVGYLCPICSHEQEECEDDLQSTSVPWSSFSMKSISEISQ